MCLCSPQPSCAARHSSIFGSVYDDDSQRALDDHEGCRMGVSHHPQRHAIHWKRGEQIGMGSFGKVGQPETEKSMARGWDRIVAWTQRQEFLSITLLYNTVNNGLALLASFLHPSIQWYVQEFSSTKLRRDAFLTMAVHVNHNCSHASA